MSTRLLLLALCVSPLGPPLLADEAKSARQIVDRAVAAAGGAKLLAAQQSLSGTSRGTIHLGEARHTIENTWTVEGLDKLWALRSRLEIPLAHIKGVRADPAIAQGWWHGFRLGGTNVPGILSAGTFYKDGAFMFWDVHNPERTIVVELIHEIENGVRAQSMESLDVLAATQATGMITAHERVNSIQAELLGRRDHLLQVSYENARLTFVSAEWIGIIA